MERDLTTNNTIYTKVATKIEHFSELAHFILMKVTLHAIMAPTIIATYFKYYVFGLGDASFPSLPLMYEIDTSFKCPSLS